MHSISDVTGIRLILHRTKSHIFHGEQGQKKKVFEE